VTDYEEFNHMYADNLAIVFGPTLLKSRDFAASMGNLGYHTSIIKCLILQYHWFFDIEEETSDIEYQEELLDPDIEVSEPEGEGIQTTHLLPDDASSFDNQSANSETHHEEIGNNFGEEGNLLWEESDGQIVQQHLDVGYKEDISFVEHQEQTLLTQPHEEHLLISSDILKEEIMVKEVQQQLNVGYKEDISFVEHQEQTSLTQSHEEDISFVEHQEQTSLTQPHEGHSLINNDIVKEENMVEFFII
ncbi:25733_t:CDS:1, partial [Racocetra persica]